jgi:hypothetical protein
VVNLPDLSNDATSAYEKINQRTLQRARCVVQEFTRRRAFAPRIRPMPG